MIEESKHKGLNKEGHLDENSLAICAEWLEGINKILDPELKNHLEECDQCRNDVLEISEFVNNELSTEISDNRMREKFEETCAVKYSPSIKQVSGSQFWRVAAIFLILITITSLAIFIKPDKGNLLVSNGEPADSSILDSMKRDKVSAIDKSDTIQSGKEKAIKIESTNKSLLADNYIPNPGLEALIGTQFRDSGRPIIESPPQDTSLTVGAILKFNCNNPKNENLELQILDNSGDILMSYTDLKKVSLNIYLEFPQGILYWKLLGEGELYQVGKILLR